MQKDTRIPRGVNDMDPSSMEGVRREVTKDEIDDKEERLIRMEARRLKWLNRRMVRGWSWSWLKTPVQRQ